MRSKLVEFNYHAVLQQAESKRRGHPVYKDEIYIKIRPVLENGSISRNTEIHRLATDEDRMKYPDAWLRFQARQDAEKLNGTPLGVLPGAIGALRMTLEGAGIRTIEALAEAGDVSEYIGAEALQKRARGYLAALKVDLDVEFEESTDNDQLELVPKKKPGRPRRETIQ